MQKALGLNFPPCVQQEINAIAQYVDLHTVKDLRVEQNGSVVTITCYTEGEQEKVFTVTLPEVNVDVLFNLIKGSSSVVVDKSEDGTNLVVKLEQSVLNDINSKLAKPANPTSESAVTMLADGTVGTKPLSEIGGSGGKLYRHDVTISNLTSGYLHCTIINNTNTEFAASDLNDLFFKKVIRASVDVISMHKTYAVKLITVTSTGISAIYYASYPFSDTVSLSFSQNDLFTDTVTEL